MARRRAHDAAPVSRSTTSPPDVSVLIVNFNSSALLRRCLDALLASSLGSRVEIIVVDNASSDFDATAFSHEYPGVAFLPQDTNLTYTGANNVAFRAATGDHILLLNPDTEVDAEGIKRALRHLAARQELVAVTARLTGPDAALQRYYRRLPTPMDVPTILFARVFGNTPRGRKYLMSDEAFDVPTVVEQPPGAFLMFRRGAIEGELLLDPAYLNFFSDTDLSRRLAEKGATALFPDIRCFHVLAGAGVGTTVPLERLRLYHDFTWGVNQYFRDASGAVRLFVRAMGVVYLATRCALQVRQSPSCWGSALQTVIDGVRGRRPVYP